MDLELDAPAASISLPDTQFGTKSGMLLLQKLKINDIALVSDGMQQGNRSRRLGIWKPIIYRCKTFGITVTCDNWEGRLHIYRTCCSRRTQLEKAQATICWILLFTLGNVLQERDELKRDLAD